MPAKKKRSRPRPTFADPLSRTGGEEETGAPQGAGFAPDSRGHEEPHADARRPETRRERRERERAERRLGAPAPAGSRKPAHHPIMSGASPSSGGGAAGGPGGWMRTVTQVLRDAGPRLAGLWSLARQRARPAGPWLAGRWASACRRARPAGPWLAAVLRRAREQVRPAGPWLWALWARAGQRMRPALPWAAGVWAVAREKARPAGPWMAGALSRARGKAGPVGLWLRRLIGERGIRARASLGNLLHLPHKAAGVGAGARARERLRPARAWLAAALVRARERLQPVVPWLADAAARVREKLQPAGAWLAGRLRPAGARERLQPAGVWLAGRLRPAELWLAGRLVHVRERLRPVGLYLAGRWGRARAWLRANSAPWVRTCGRRAQVYVRRARAAGVGRRVRDAAAHPPPAVLYAGLFLLFFALYRRTATHGYTFDAVAYALQIRRFSETGEWRWLFHPHHILFNALGLLAFRVLHALGRADDPLAALQTLNAFLGASGVVLFAAAAERACRHRRTALIAAGGLGLSYGYWVCATDGRVNLAGTVVLAAALFPVVALLEPRKRWRPAALVRLAAGLGALHALAVLLHQSHLLFAPAALAALVLPAGRPRKLLLAAYVGAAAAVCGTAYLVAARLAAGAGGPAGAANWALTYAEHGHWWSFAVWTNLGRDAQAFAHAVMASPALSGAAPGAGGARARLLILAGGALACVPALRLVWPRRRGGLRARLVPVLLLWMAAYAVFFTFWNPGYFVFWVPLLVPYWLLVAVGLSLAPGWRIGWVPCGAAAAVGLALLAGGNVAVGLAPHADPEANPHLQKALAIQERTLGDLVVLAGAGDNADAEVYVPYFAQCDAVSLQTELSRSPDWRAALAEIGCEIDRALASGRRVLVYEELLSSEGPYKVLAPRFGLQRREFVRFLQSHYTIGRPARWLPAAPLAPK